MKKLLGINLFGLLLLLSSCGVFGDTFELVDEAYINVTIGQTYEDPGFSAKSGLKDLSEYVTVTNNIDETQPGDYTITYHLVYDDTDETLIRNVYYRNEMCERIFVEEDGVYDVTNLTRCTIQFTEYLDTFFSLQYYYEDDVYHNKTNTIKSEIESILSEYHQLSDKYNTYEGITNIKTINDMPTALHHIDERLFDMIEFSLLNQPEVNNEFNIALGPVINIWHDYRDNCIINEMCDIPDQEELNNAGSNIDPNDITINSFNHTISMQEGMSLDLGGVSKGYITGVITDYLNTLNLDGYLINNGNSNISVGGNHPTRDNGLYMIAIEDPTTVSGLQSNYYATIYIGDDEHIITSGDSQKYYTVNDTRYHHLISNETFYPVTYSHSVTLVTNDPALGDIYSTALYLMPIDEALEFVNNHENLEAVWYNLDGSLTFSEYFERDYLNEILID